jgi:hypothetical protein
MSYLGGRFNVATLHVFCHWASFGNARHPHTELLMQVQPFKAHKIEPPSNKVETTVAELRSIYHLMYKMRRMEIAADMMYKAKLIRGFCHL